MNFNTLLRAAIIALATMLFGSADFKRILAIVEKWANKKINWFHRKNGVVQAIAPISPFYALQLLALEDEEFHKVVQYFLDINSEPAVVYPARFIDGIPNDALRLLTAGLRTAEVVQIIDAIDKYEGSAKRRAVLDELRLIGLDFAESMARIAVELAVRFIKTKT